MKKISNDLRLTWLQNQAKFICFLLLFSYSTTANNITVTNISLTGQNITEHYTMVKLDLSWENSWRVSIEPLNWDAAWVFVKYKVAASNGGDGLWRHSTLNVTGHNAPAVSTITVPSDGMGGFVYRSADGVGTLTLTNVQLRWNYGVNYKNSTTLIGDADIVDIRVYAIEMVYVPQGAYELGSGGGQTSEFFKYPNSTNTYRVTSENAITVGTAADNLYYGASTYGGDQLGPVPAAFPKGYNSFYCMKYEISQQGYVDFLNSLSPLQASNRFPNAFGNFRHGITSGAVYSTSNPYVACNYIGIADFNAYLDWAGLRPMSEFEFEKACRGSTNFPVPNEYAWGTAGNLTNVSGLLNTGLINEISSNSSSNAICGLITSGYPVRCGMFAKTGNSRIQSGATFFGIMEMSGNLMELTVSIGNPKGRSFTGVHGNGMLDVNGYADAANWPENSTGLGICWRGGEFYDLASYMFVSQRVWGVYTTNGRFLSLGIRGVRTAP